MLKNWKDMLKNLFVLTLLLPVVFGRFTPNERQWNDDDVRQINCTEICTISCDNCTEPILCSDSEDKCPDDNSNVHDDCPVDDICVPAGCQCRTKGTNGNVCPLICPVICDDDEILCPGGWASDGCKENDYCHPRGTGLGGVLCVGFCPKDCSDEENKCPVPNDPITDCEKEPLCVPVQKDRWGYDCKVQECPIYCDYTEIFCAGETDYRGCRTGDTCLPKGTDDNGELCPGVCPVECEDDEVLCQGQEDENGCKLTDFCNLKARDKNMDYCPDNSYSHECPVTCEEYEILCPPKRDIVNCLEEAICTNRTIDNNGNFCPEDLECPVDCPPGTISCPTGTDDNGCKKPEVCEIQERSLNGELCTVHCLIHCNDEEIFCAGFRNENGCTEPATCVTRAIKTRGADKGGLCPGVCPANCWKDEILCPSQEDPCDGCPTEETCRVAAKDVNDIPCSGLDYPNEYFSASHGCPKICDELDGYTSCPAHEMANGCRLETICLPRGKDSNEDWCPSHSTCPHYCKNNELRCDYGIDIRGCKEAPMCIEIGKDKDGMQCPGYCPPICKQREALQPASIDANGCQFSSTCQDIMHVNQTFHCYEWRFVSCVETPNAECDFGGYYEPRQWKQSLQKATEWCLDQADCVGITRGNDGYEPRKGPSISHSPIAYEAWFCIDAPYNPYYQQDSEV